MDIYNPQVCIIGGGVAGLVAANHLTANGVHVLLLEGRDRLGGRILTEFSPLRPDAPIELGAEFVHGRPPGLRQLLRHGGLRLREMGGTTYQFSEQNLRPLSDDDNSEVEKVLESDELARQDQSLREYLERSGLDTRAKGWIASYVEGFNAASSERIGTRALCYQQMAEDHIDGGRAWRLDGGYVGLVRLLYKQLGTSAQLLLNTTAKNIEWKPGAVRVTAQDNDRGAVTVNARSAIVTVPLGVLLGRSDTSRIAFDPQPAVFEELDLLAAGSATRLNLLFSKPVWESAAPDAGFLLSQEQHFPTWWTRSAGNAFLLTGWNGGPKADALTGLPVDTLIDLAMGTLSKILRIDTPTLKSKLESAHYHDWQSDPFSCGSYSYVTVGGFDFSQRIAHPIANTLCFAGEAIASDGHWGTVHGAIESGRHAAMAVLASL